MQNSQKYPPDELTFRSFFHSWDRFLLHSVLEGEMYNGYNQSIRRKEGSPMRSARGLYSILNTIICNTEEERAEEQARVFALSDNEREQQQESEMRYRYLRHRRR